MKIDNRLFIVPAAPFVCLAIVRAVWWVAGAEWSEPEIGAAISLMVGIVGGCITTGALFAEGVSIGHTTIGKAPK